MPEEPRYPTSASGCPAKTATPSPSSAAPTAPSVKPDSPQDEIDQYYAEATSGDHDHLLQSTMR